MLLSINTNIEALVGSLGSPYPLTAPIEANRFDTPEIQFQFGVPFGSPVQIDAAVAISNFILGAKTPENYGGDYDVSNWNQALNGGAGGWAYTRTGDGTAGNPWTYTVNLPLDADELNDAFVNGVISQTVANQAARYGLDGLANGIIVKETDDHTYWVVVDNGNLGNANGWGPAPQKDSVLLDADLTVEYVNGTEQSYPFSILIANNVNQGNEGGVTSANPAYPAPATILTNGQDTPNLKRGQIALVSGSNTQAVAFATPFAAPPISVFCSVSKANPADDNVFVSQDTVTVNGFNANLSGAATPGSILNWMALL